MYILDVLQQWTNAMRLILGLKNDLTAADEANALQTMTSMIGIVHVRQALLEKIVKPVSTQITELHNTINKCAPVSKNIIHNIL